MEDQGNEILKKRIRERLEALGKNPSSVALDAKLSRSAVRDILSGKAKNPGFLTIHAIANVLECSYGYLTGEQDTLHASEATDTFIDAFIRTRDISGTLQAGVFRQLPIGDTDGALFEFGRRDRKPIRSKHRYIHRDLFIYKVGDDSLAGKSIVQGDYLTAVFDPTAEAAPDGRLVIAAHRLKDTQVEEISARLVRRNSRGFTLVTVPDEFGGSMHAPIEVVEKLETYGHFRTSAGGLIIIEAVVVELTRQLD